MTSLALAPAAGSRRDRRRAARSQRQQSKAHQTAVEKLTAWQREADRRSRLLGAEAVWALVDEHRREATQLDVMQELTDVCFVAAGRMADPRGLRSGMRYYKFGER